MEELTVDELIATAELFRRIDKYEPCEKLLQKALIRFPNHPKSLLCLAKLNAQRHNYTDAVSYLEQLLALEEGKSIEAFELIGGLFIKLRNPESAVRWCQQVKSLIIFLF